MDTKAQHILVDIWLDADLEDRHLDIIKNLIDQNLTVVRKVDHKFEPQGETLVWILAESHFSLHTYPEHRYLSFDIYICNLDIDIKDIVERIKQALPVKFVDQKYSLRGHKYQNHDLNITEAPTETFKLTAEQKKNGLILGFFSALVSCCSLLYELLLAQTLATTMGNTVLRYNVTIGLYIASMGIGALCYQRIRKWWLNYKRESEYTGFIAIEILMGLVGFLAPIMVLIFDSFFQRMSNDSFLAYQGTSAQILIFGFNHILIFVIGFISGLELPLLMDFAKRIHQDYGKRILAFDYFGTLIAAILFPIVLVPYFKLFTLAAMVAFINMLAALLFVVYQRLFHMRLLIPIFVILFLQLGFIIFSGPINEFIIDSFYFLGNR